jgi:hypothetical protein
MKKKIQLMRLPHGASNIQIQRAGLIVPVLAVFILFLVAQTVPVTAQAGRPLSDHVPLRSGTVPTLCQDIKICGSGGLLSQLADPLDTRATGKGGMRFHTRSSAQLLLTTSQILYPISDVKIGLWSEGVPGADPDNYRFNEIDDPQGYFDGDNTYIVTSAIKSYLAGTTRPSVPENAVNISVALIWTVRYELPDTFHASWTRIGMNNVYYFGPRHVARTEYTTYTDTWTNNPATGQAWTPATVNTVNILGFDSNRATPVHITQAYIQVSYELGPIVSIDVEKYIWSGTDWVDADEATGPHLLLGTNPQFKFILTNPGEVTLSNVDLVDNMYGNIALDGNLLAGESIEYFLAGSWEAGQHTNVATVTGDYDGNTYSDSDPANYFGSMAVMTLIKLANPTTFGLVGDVINYAYELINTGDLPLEAPFTVSDDRVAVSCPEIPTSLSPGESIICTSSYAITLADLSAGSVTNTAQGYGYYDGDLVSSNTGTETVIANESQLGSTYSTCASMRDRLIAGTALEQAQILYSGTDTILSINGVTAYWTRINDLSGSLVNLAVSQTITSDYGFTKYLGVKVPYADNIKLYDSSCRIVTVTISNLQGGTVNDATVYFTLNANRDLPVGQYFLVVRYDHALLRNQPIGPTYPAIGQTLSHYDFSTLLEDNPVAQDGIGSHTDGYGGLDLKRR